MLPDLMERFGVPGVALGILNDDREEVATHGVTSLDNPLPVEPTTLFQIGSITKTITATAIMRLVEQGRAQLDGPVRRYLPEFKLADEGVAERATIQHLLTHTGGWVGDDFSDTGSGDDALERYVGGLVELPQITPLGELYSYCNSGFAVAGRIVEVLCGKPYETAVRELVLEPLGMSHSFFSTTWLMTYRFVVGHLNSFEPGGSTRIARPWALTRAANSMGGLTTCIPDLLRYARFVLGKGPGGFLSDELRKQMHTPLAPAGCGSDSVGVAWHLREVDAVRIVGHSGGTHGQSSNFSTLPERGFASIVLTNSSRGSELIGELNSALFEQHLGLHTRHPEPTYAATNLEQYAGHYDSWISDADVSVDDNGLVVQLRPKPGFPFKGAPRGPDPPPVRFRFYAEDRIIGLDDPLRHAQAEFIRDRGGKIAWLRLGGRLRARQ